MNKNFGKNAEKDEQKEIDKRYWPLILKSSVVILVLLILEGLILNKNPAFKYSDLFETVIGSVSLTDVFYFPKFFYFFNVLLGWIINAFILGLIVIYILEKKLK